ncbi:hypothetical protein Q8791_23550 [Nocardiopsis sp. CT-R113]|uniref:Uncharacterized protein n=1 Tax=Nocardiopsis codii TaxID=3065942 RepID=A0ABU7KF28_9ACTN|nr:hypothetical protein [Nocardiopsis sp. CT-R113]MEE2040197.1 hypothetical protein [Nocardiopsis sp. CT-R113]
MSREDAQLHLTAATCYLGVFTTISLLSGNWGYLVGGLIMALVVAPLAFLAGYVVYRFFGWVLEVNR